MAEVVPIRNPSTVLFGVSSADRYNANNQENFKGEIPNWDAGSTYAINNRVVYQDIAYESLTNGNINQIPTATLGTEWRYANLPFWTRSPLSSPFNFTLYSQQAFLNGYFTRLALTEITFTWAIPTITARNNKIGVRYDAGSGTRQTVLTIDSAWYSLSDLAAEVQSKFRTATGINAFTLTVSTSGNFVAESNGTELFAFTPVVTPISGTGTNPKTKSQPDRIQLFDMMNWEPASPGPLGSVMGTDQTSGTPTLLSTKFVDIVSSRITQCQNTRDGDTGHRPRDVIARVYLQGETDQLNPESLGSQPFVVYKNYTLPKQITWDPTVPLGQLSFTLYDDQGYELSTMDDDVYLALFNDETQPDWNATFLASEA